MNQSLLTVVVKNKSPIAQGICAFELVDPDNRELPPFSAGSHIDLHIRSGLVRQYSLCNKPSERHRYVLGILRDEHSRGGSLALHERVKEGDFIKISQPRNNFSLVRGARKSILLAGGIGVTPILCMAEQLAAESADFEMHYCSRSRMRAAFLDRISSAHFADKVKLYFDDEHGRAVNLDQILKSPSDDAHVYVCGPKPFIDAVMNIARLNGWATANLHSEHFAAASASNARDDNSFEVRLRSTGKAYPIPSNTTVVQALAKHRIVIPTSCEQGLCGACLTRVIDGVPLHRDQYLTDEEKSRNDCFLPCCSRSQSASLTLDI